MRTVCYNTASNKEEIYNDWLSFRTNIVYFIEHKRSALFHAPESSLPQYLFLYSDDNQMIGFFFLYGTQIFIQGSVPFVAISNIDELEAEAGEFFATGIQTICMQYNEPNIGEQVWNSISYSEVVYENEK